MPIDSVRLQMRSLGQSDASFGFLRLSKRLFRASLRPVPFPFFVHGTAVLLPSGRDGMEWKRHSFFGGYCNIHVI